MLTNKNKPLIMLIGVAGIWGVSAPIIKYTLNYIPPITFLFIRFLFAALVLYFLVNWKKHNYYIKLRKKGFLKIFLLGTLGSAISLGLVFYGIERTTSIEATIITSSSPLLTLLGGSYFLNEKITKRELLGVLITLAGFGLVIFKPILHLDPLEPSKDSITGNMLLVLSTISWAAYLLISKNIFNHDKTEKRFSPTLITFITFFAGAVVLMPFSLYEIVTYKIEYAKALPGIIYMTVFASIIAYNLYEHAIKKIDAGKASLIQYTTPLFTLPIALFFLGERFSKVYLMGGSLLILGIFISETSKKVKNKVKSYASTS